MKNLKERFATLQIGPQSAVLFDYKEDESSVKVSGMYTLGPTAKCVAGDSCWPYPAELVTKFLIGTGDEHVMLCFDNQEEIASFKAALEFGLNAKNILKAVIDKKAADRKREETERIQRENAEKKKLQMLEGQLANMRQFTAENQAVNVQFEEEGENLRGTVSSLRSSVSAEKHMLELEREQLRAAFAQQLLETQQSAEEVAARAQQLAQSNQQASISLAEMSSSIDKRFTAFRKRENSSSVLRNVDVAEYNHRLEAEKLEMMAREQEALDRQAKAAGDKTQKDMERALSLRAEAGKSSAQDQEREFQERQAAENARKLQAVKDAEAAIAQRAESAKLYAQARENEIRARESAQTSQHAVASSVAKHPVKSAIMERASFLQEAPVFVPQRPSTVVEREESLAAGGAVSIKERMKRMSVAAEGASSPSQKPSLAKLLETEGIVGSPATAASPQPGAMPPASAASSSEEPRVERISDRIKRLSVTAAASPQPSDSSGAEGVVSIKERMKRLSAVAADISSFSQPDVSSGTQVDAEVVVPVKERVKRSSLVAAAVALSSNSPADDSSAAHAPASERAAVRRPSVDGVASVSLKERLQHLNASGSPQAPLQKQSEKLSLSHLLQQDQAAAGTSAADI